MAPRLVRWPTRHHTNPLVSRSGDRGRAWPSGRDPVEEGRGSTGQDAEATQAGATSRTGQQRTDRRWPGSPGTGKGETVR